MVHDLFVVMELKPELKHVMMETQQVVMDALLIVKSLKHIHVVIVSVRFHNEKQMVFVLLTATVVTEL